MALVTECPKCGKSRVIDTQCIIKTHEMILEQQRLCREADEAMENLMHAMRLINPCPKCRGRRNNCSSCNNTGYKPITGKLRQIANAPDPKPTY